jgi:hypothetical protein
MRKLLALPLFLAVLVDGAAEAALPPNQCPIYTKDDKGAVKAAPAPLATDCFAGEVFVMNGDPLMTANVMVPGAMPTDPPKTVPLYSCATMGTTTTCALGDVASPHQGAPIRAIADRAIEAAKAKGAAGEYDEVVLFTADFGATNLGPLFFRGLNSAGMPMNTVNGIGLNVVPRDPAKGYVGIINAGNVKTIGANPSSGAFAPCAQGSSLCASGLFSYFDSLAQATANLYGPYLKDPRGPDVVVPPVPPATMPTMMPGPLLHGGTIVSMPASKGDLVTLTGQVVTPKIADGPVTNVWNGLLNLNGSILGGNTWVDNGNATWLVSRPPAFQGVSAPFDGAQVPRFAPIDNYVMGFIPATAVPDLRSLMAANAASVYTPIVGSFNANVGPAMGTRTSGAAIRNGANVPKNVKFADYLAPNGGDRSPNSEAPGTQRIRQLWVLITKPMASGDAVKEQANEVELLQKFRQEYNRYFYTLTGYQGRVHTTVDSNVDDSGYFEFGDARDDGKEFAAQGGLEMQIRGIEEVPNSGGKAKSVLWVKHTPGGGGVITYNAQARPIRISGDLGPEVADAKNDGSRSGAPNMVTVRMRLPNDPAWLAQLKANPGMNGGLFAKLTLHGSANVEVLFPRDEKAFLVPDGRFRNYSVDLTQVPGFRGGEFNGFTFSPSSQENWDVEVEYIRFSNTAWGNLKDSDQSCTKTPLGDGWLDVEDNCKAVWNPGQEDGNGDGVGDACEDYDGDNVVNACDNCPTVTNSSQRDNNRNNAGDACDGTKETSCFFQTSSVGGPLAPTSAVVWVATLALAGVVLSAWRRRRRR